MSDIIIYGRGKTGKSIYDMLQKQGQTACFYDDINGFSNGSSFTSNSVVIVSPGIKPYAKGMESAKRVNAKIIGELQYCIPLCSGKIISVTGTNGKTTTCEMIYHSLNQVGFPCRLLGNGGVPLSSQVLDVKEEEIVILESSSFQLMNCDNFSPLVSVFTSLASDHLDYHGSFEKYSRAKCNNFIHQKSSAFAIFNADDEKVMQVSSCCPCRKLFYSIKDNSANVYFDGERVFIEIDGKKTIAKARQLSKYAKHNLSNALATILTCQAIGVNADEAINALSSYSFLPHRLQSVATYNNIEFVDDSKATNVHATVSALNNYSRELALILGGSSKGESFDVLFEGLPTNVLWVVAVGDTAKEIVSSGHRCGVDVHILKDIKEAVKYCYELLLHKGGGIVLMSNACASFDKFSSYAERGEFFQNAVRELMCGEKTN